MSTEAEDKKQDEYPRVEDFYNGKSVLITGAAGFVGMVILEILLRNVPDVKAVYLLLRGKKGMDPEERMKKLFQKEIFNKLKEDNPNAFLKTHLVKGDVALPNLGMSEEDLQEVIQNVSIVFHCAAIINHTKPLKEVLETNAVGTHYVVELCKRLMNLEVLVYTSTICSNCNRHQQIQEEVYRLPFPPQKFLDAIENGTDESLEALASQCLPHWPNSYTFSKCLAENIILESESEVPFAIIRPSLVFNAWKTPYAGFAERNSALSLLCGGVGKGFIKVVHLDRDLFVDLVPVDVVVNAHIIAAWKVASGRSPSPFVMNCTSYGVLYYSWAKFAATFFNLVKKFSIPNCFRKSNGYKLIKSVPMYKVLTFYEHYVPAYFMDFCLLISGKKPKLVNLYQLYDKASMAISFFTTVNWTYDTKNFHGLQENIDPQDNDKFYTNISDLSLESLADDMRTGYSDFDWSRDKRTQEDRKKKAEERYRLTLVVQYSFLVLVCILLYYIFSQVLSMTKIL